jgi:formylglycine-generating enzyme required for sulfatase activity
MLRFLRVASLAAGCALLATTSCGGDDTSGSGDGAGPNFPTAPGTGGTSISLTGKSSKSNSRSCDGKSAGADNHCGGVEGDESQPGNQDCCETREVPGGTYNRFNDPKYPAKVSKFKLDTFLVTVGRFRQWVAATKGNLQSSAPPPGAGANPHIPGSGWRSEWNRFLPTSTADVERMFGPEYDVDSTTLACQYGTLLDQQGALTYWTKDLDKNIKAENVDRPEVLRENTKDALDRKPLNCVPWHVLFAFCIWDGGRLPTDAEFGFAALGGDEQRKFAWGNLEGDDVAPIGGREDLSSPPVFNVGKKYVAARLWDTRLGNGQNVFEDNYGLTWGDNVFGKADNAFHVMPVGRRPAGNGRWGQADLNGNMFEWMLDEGPVLPGTCNDCANVNWPKPTDLDPKAKMDQPEFKNDTPGGVNWWRGGARAIRGSAWDNAVFLANTQSKDEIEYYTSYPVLRTYRSLGGRCARDF